MEESARCFKEALKLCPDFALAHWGVSAANGPNYNLFGAGYIRCATTNFACSIAEALEHAEAAAKLVDSACARRTARHGTARHGTAPQRMLTRALAR